MRRRDLIVAGAAGLVALAGLAEAAGGMVAEIELEGRTFRYEAARGVNLGDYADPEGRFIQTCTRVDHPDLPLTVFFRPDRDGRRLEVVFELGRLWESAEPRNLGPYKARVSVGSTVVALIDVPAHYWFSRWRWQSQLRPVRVKPDTLMASWAAPRIDPGIGVNQRAGGRAGYAPMGLAGLTPYMPTTGERDDIGLVTEPQAHYLATGDGAALALVVAQAEAAGTFPWNMRDEHTSAPLDTFAYPRATLYGPSGGSPYIRGARTPLTPDAAHQPALSYLPFMLTGDPYHLEQLQLTATWNVIWRPADYRYRTTQVRGEAWSMRTWAQLAKVTPERLPRWMLPRVHWQRLLGSYRDWYSKTFVQSPERSRTVFRSTDQVFGEPNRVGLPGGTYTAPWMDDFLTAVFGWMVLMGHADWRPIYDWKIGSAIARTNGQSGWPRAYCTPYQMVLRSGSAAPWAASWQEAWLLTNAWLKVDVSDPDRLDLKPLFCIPYTRGVLVLGKHLGVRDADACLAWANRELGRALAARKPFPYKWALV